MTLPLSAVAVVAVAGLVAIGLYGLLITRNLIKVVVALQILVKGALVALIAAARPSGQINLAQSLALTVIVADTIVSVVALALAVQVRRRFGTLDLQALTTLRR
jgi:NADH:ubiquinone oxidoreductase subunit K